jgi:hypothetical protein
LRRSPLQSSFDSTAAPAFRRSQLPTRVSALFATSPQSVHSLRGVPVPRYVPSSGDPSLPTVCSALWLVSLFHPTAASRALPVQGFRRSAKHPSFIRRSCPLAVAARPAHRRIGCHAPRTSASRPCSVQSRVPQARRLDRTCDRSPPRVRCSSRYPPGRSLRFPGDHRSWRFPPGPSTARTRSITPTPRLQRLDDQDSRRLVSETADLLELSSLPETCRSSHVTPHALSPRASGSKEPSNRRTRVVPGTPWLLGAHNTLCPVKAFGTPAREPRHQSPRRAPTPRP